MPRKPDPERIDADAPEATADWFERARPAAEVLPGLVGQNAADELLARRRGRPPAIASTHRPLRRKRPWPACTPAGVSGQRSSAPAFERARSDAPVVPCYNCRLLPRRLRLSGAGPLRGPPLFFVVLTTKIRPYRTIVYVDGFNFYYGTVRGTPWKWLDPVALFEKVLGPQNELVKVKYFTARVQPSPRDPEVNVRQDAYLRALQAHCPLVELYYGQFLRHRVSMEHANPPPASVEVWRNEEKGSDVNLALHLLNDSWLSAYDCAVVVSNDSDLAESLRLVRAQNHKLVGLVTPGAPKRKTSRQLRQHANFLKPIRTWMLEASQLPEVIPGTSIHKPGGW